MKLNSRGLPTSSSTLKSASPPTGAALSTIFERDIAILLYSASVAFFLPSAALTASDKALAFSNSAVFSSPFADPTLFERVFCSAFKASNSTIALRLISSAAITRSTRDTSSPRAL